MKRVNALMMLNLYSCRQPYRRASGFTLVEVSLLCCLLGILLSVFIPAFATAVRTSRVSEAVEHLQEMHERAAAYYQKPQRLASGRMSSRCLPPPAGPVPAEPQAQPQAVDWRHAALPGQTTWQSLGFQPAEPLRYAYEFLPRSYGCELRKPASGPLLTLRAHGDLDGDGRLSTLERHANPQDDSTLAPYGVLWIDQRIE